MTDTTAPAWRPTRLGWTEAGAALEWLSPTGDVRASAVDLGARLSLAVGPDRRCTGLRWDGRRVPCTARKRGARLAPGTASARAAELVAVAEQAADLDWPPGQTRTATGPVDHTPSYGLPDGGIAPDQQIDPLRAGATINGEVVCRIGRDLYLSTPDGIVLLDSGLLQGWALNRAEGDAALTAKTTPVVMPRAMAEVQYDVLF